MTEVILNCQQLCYQIKNKKILNNINLEILAGEFKVILGANGVGKSTLLKILSGQLLPTSGSRKVSRDIEISYLGHQSQLYMDLSVAENFEFFAEFFSMPVNFEEELSKWRLLDQRKLPVKQLSQGQTKRLSLAISLAMPANIYLLDEPYSNLDQLGKEILNSEIEKIRREAQVSFVLITHELISDFPDACDVYFLGVEKLELIYSKSESSFNLNTIQQRYLELLRL